MADADAAVFGKAAYDAVLAFNQLHLNPMESFFNHRGRKFLAAAIFRFCFLEVYLGKVNLTCGRNH